MLQKQYVFLAFCVSINLTFAKHVIIETAKTKYLAQTQENKTKPKTAPGADYEIGWIDHCSLKSAHGDSEGNGKTRGEIVTKVVSGCDGIELKCTGGCLKISKSTYFCKQQGYHDPKYLELVQNKCDKKEYCKVSAISEIFGNIICSDKERSLTISYRCDGGQDRTKLVGSTSCGGECVGMNCELKQFCGDGKRGAMVQKDLIGGKKLSITCIGGCIKIMKVLYSCKIRKSSKASQLSIVKGLCEDKTNCEVSATREMFGETECAGRRDAEMNLWIVYRCDGGKEIPDCIGGRCKPILPPIIECNDCTCGKCRPTIIPPVCNGCLTDKICGDGKRGLMVQKDIIGGEKLTITCVGGCITIMKILYSCKIRKSSNPSQLKVVKRLCEDVNKCEVSATRDLFGDTECPGMRDEEMNLWIVYRCDGGEEIPDCIGDSCIFIPSPIDGGGASNECNGDVCRVEASKECIGEDCRGGTSNECIGHDCHGGNSKECIGEDCRGGTSKECIGNACRGETSKECTGEDCRGGTTKECTGEDCRGETSKECIGDACKGGTSKECIGHDCRGGTSKECIGDACTGETSKQCIGDDCRGRTSKECIGDACRGETSNECTGDDCIGGTSKECIGDNCKGENSKECIGDDCRSGTSNECIGDACRGETSKECTGEDCIGETTKECSGDDCRGRTSKECIGDACRGETSTECTGDNCRVGTSIECVGDNCKGETSKECIGDDCRGRTSKACIGDACRGETSKECTGDDCRGGTSKECIGDNCKAENSKECIGDDCRSGTSNECIGDACRGEIGKECFSDAGRGETSKECTGDDCRGGISKECIGDNCKGANSKECIGDDCRGGTSKECIGDACRGETSKECTGDDCRGEASKECVGDDCRGGACGGGKKGPMVQKDLTGGGKLTMTCTGGCLRILKVLFSCKFGKQMIASQVKIVKGLCEGNSECAVTATRRTFGDSECPGLLDKEMKLWVTYSCDGGHDNTLISYQLV